MKRRTIISLIVAAALVLVGAVLLAVGLYTADGNTYATKFFSLEERTVAVGQTFESVVVETGDCDVIFVPFNGNADPHIVLLEREKIGHDVTVKDGVLEIKMNDHRQWLDYISFGVKTMKMTVYLPRKQYESLRVTTDTGDIQIPEALSAKEIRLSSDTGDILCEGAAKDTVGITTDTGDIRVKNCAPAMLELQSDTGDLLLEQAAPVEIHLTTNTGEMDAVEISCAILTCKSDTGDVALKKVRLSGTLQIFTNTGDVKIEDSDTVRINIKTNTGDVRVPKAWQTKDYRIETDTGKIRFE